MTEYQEEDYREIVKDMEHLLTQQGYLSAEFAIIGYFLLKNHIKDASMLQDMLEHTDELIKQAEELIKRM